MDSHEGRVAHSTITQIHKGMVNKEQKDEEWLDPIGTDLGKPEGPTKGKTEAPYKCFAQTFKAPVRSEGNDKESQNLKVDDCTNIQSRSDLKATTQTRKETK